jgi:hypothetical protein
MLGHIEKHSKADAKQTTIAVVPQKAKRKKELDMLFTLSLAMDQRSNNSGTSCV